MPEFKLPENWYVERTDANFKTINAWLNKKCGNPTAYEKGGGFVTNHTERGVQAPFKTAPKNYTKITFEQFEIYVAGNGPVKNGIPAMTLPMYWVVKAEFTENFRKVLEFINNNSKSLYKGKQDCYYGFDGEYKCRYELIDFFNNPTVLTCEEFVNKINNIPAPIPVRLPEPMFVAPVAPAPVQVVQRDVEVKTYLAGHKLVKRYPGSMQIGYTTVDSNILDVRNEMFAFIENWEPIIKVLPAVGSTVKVLRVPDGWHAIKDQKFVVNANLINPDDLATIRVFVGGMLKTAPARFFDMVPEPDEVVVNIFRCIPEGNNISVRKGQDNNRVILSKEDLIRFKEINSPVFAVRIGAVPAVLTNATIDAMLQLL